MQVVLSGLVETGIGMVSSLIEVLAAIVVGYGVMSAFYHVVITSLLKVHRPSDDPTARINLGRRLAIGLEFELGADLLQTAVSPTWNHIGIVGAIIILRSVLNIILEKEIEYLETRLKRSNQEQQSCPRSS